MSEQQSHQAQAAPRPSAIPGYEDWPDYVRGIVRGTGVHRPDSAAAQGLADALGVPESPGIPVSVWDWEEEYDGVITSRLSWQLGFGPKTGAWYLRPSGVTEPLPGILAMHCHGGNKFIGAERLVNLPTGHPLAKASRMAHYDGRGLATELAKGGFAVLAHDTFAWGSRRFDLTTPPWRTEAALEARLAQWREAGVVPSQADLYNAAAAIHEDTVAKAAGLLGTSFAGMVAHDDLAALEILAGLPGVAADRLGCIGFSGGGGRSLTLAALSPKVRSYVVICMMTTFDSLVPAYLDAHSWLLQTPGLRRLGDWPELAAHSSAESLLVQYALADELFPEEGMRDAHAQLLALKMASHYRGSFWPGGHEFTVSMQEEATQFLQDTLSSTPATKG
ncbi:acetylesterase [Arthrobacter sp.]|uniref:acetylesterase n=1 Tax=Arthrobacter sp. TaxID=1667 RepID=UPI002810A084|nr:acetylesterase [Arthrobacter sp.]